MVAFVISFQYLAHLAVVCDGMICLPREWWMSSSVVCVGEACLSLWWRAGDSAAGVGCVCSSFNCGWAVL